jgi:hypothetical protein
MLASTFSRSFRELVVPFVLVSWWSVNFVSVVEENGTFLVAETKPVMIPDW